MIARETFTAELLAELAPLIEENHAATGSRATLDPAWSTFDHLEQGGALCLIVARVDGLPVGYVAHAMLNHQLHGERWAQCVAIYVRPAHRSLARALVRQAADLAKAAGAQVISYNVPALSRAGSFLEAEGYEVAEVVCNKRLTA